MDFSKTGLQKLFAGTFGRKWRSTVDILQTQQFDITDYDIQDISGGYLNQVYRLRSQKDHAHSVIVKHAPPYIQCLGLKQPLGDKRIYTEYLALRRFNQALPGSVPEAYFHDDEAKCVVMEDLRNYEVMSLKLTQGYLDMAQVEQLANVVAKLHRNTHLKTVSAGEFQTLLATFSNDEMVALNSDLTFTSVVDPDNPTNRCSSELAVLAQSIREDPLLLDCVHVLHAIFLEQKDCLTHGDLHLGSVMVNGRNLRVIDAEFAFMGPAGADIGLILANYIFSYAAHTLYPKPESPSFSNLVQEAIRVTVDVYFDEAKAYLNDEDLVALVSQTAGFTGCHVIKWMIGIAEARDLQDKPQAELMSLNIGVRLTKEYHTITSPHGLLQCIFHS